MQKSTNENKTMIQNKLEYIGLNLGRIPKFLTEYTFSRYDISFSSSSVVVTTL